MAKKHKTKTDTASQPHMLPPNATQLEQKLAGLTALLDKVTVDVSQLWSEKYCPPSHLPWLAWAMGLELWNNDWHPGVKHKLIAHAAQMHKYKGTRRAVRDAIRFVLAMKADPQRTNLNNLADFDASYVIREWWEQDDAAADASIPVKRANEPLTFQVLLHLGEGMFGSGVDGKLTRDLRRAIDAVKPLSTRYTLSTGVGLKVTIPISTSVRAIPRLNFGAILK